MRVLGKGARLSGSRESVRGPEATVMVASGTRKNAPELSDSPFNTPRKFGKRVWTAGRKQPVAETWWTPATVVLELGDNLEARETERMGSDKEELSCY